MELKSCWNGFCFLTPHQGLKSGLLQLFHIRIRCVLFLFFQNFYFTFMLSLLTAVMWAFFSIDYLFLISIPFLQDKFFLFRCYSTYVLILMLYFKVSLVHMPSYHFCFAGILDELHSCGYSFLNLQLLFLLLICSNNILKKKWTGAQEGTRSMEAKGGEKTWEVKFLYGGLGRQRILDSKSYFTIKVLKILHNFICRFHSDENLLQFSCTFSPETWCSAFQSYVSRGRLV